MFISPRYLRYFFYYIVYISIDSSCNLNRGTRSSYRTSDFSRKGWMGAPISCTNFFHKEYFLRFVSSKWARRSFSVIPRSARGDDELGAGFVASACLWKFLTFSLPSVQNATEGICGHAGVLAAAILDKLAICGARKQGLCNILLFNGILCLRTEEVIIHIQGD